MTAPIRPPSQAVREKLDLTRYKRMRDAGFSDAEIEADGFELPRGSFGSGLVGFGNEALQGATFGFADEIAGAVVPKLGDAMRERSKRFNADHPGLAIGAQMAGGLVTGGGVARGLAKGAAKLPGMVGRAVASTAGQGAITGGIAGAGVADPGSRGTGALVGGVTGGIAAPVLSAALAKAGGSKLVRGFKESMARRAGAPPLVGSPLDQNPMAGKAAQMIARKLQQDGVPVDQIETALSRYQAGDPEMLFNIGGENTTAFMRTIQSIPGRGKATVQGALDMQASEIPELVTKGMERAIGKPIPNSVTRVQELADDAARAAKPHYDGIRGQFLVDDDLTKLAGRPSIKEAVEVAKRNLLDSGEAVPDGLTVGLLDDAKKVLDDQIESINDAIQRGMASGKDKSRVLALTKARDGLVEKVDDLLGGAERSPYAKARAVAGEGIGKREAFRAGQRDSYQRADVLESDIAKLTPEERALRLEGHATDINERLTSSNPQNAASVFTPKTRRNLEITTRGTPAEDIVRETYDRAGKLQGQARASTMRGQSTTASTLRGQGEVDDEVGGRLAQGIDLAGKAATGRWGSVAADMARGAWERRVRGLSGDVAAEAADMLTTRAGDPRKRAEVLELIRMALEQRASQSAARRPAARAIGAATGAQSGRSR